MLAISVMEELSSLHLRGLALINSSLGDVQGKPWCWRKRCAQCCRWHPSLCDGAEPVPEGRKELGALCAGEPCTSSSTGVKPHRSAGCLLYSQLKNLSSALKRQVKAGLRLLVISRDFPSGALWDLLCRQSPCQAMPAAALNASLCPLGQPGPSVVHSHSTACVPVLQAPGLYRELQLCRNLKILLPLLVVTFYLAGMLKGGH